MTQTYHRLPAEHLEALFRGGGDSRAVALLRKGQRSKHTLLLRAVLDIAAATAPEEFEASGMAAGYALLCRIQRDCPEAVDRLLLHPYVGAWAAHCLRRLHGGDVDGDHRLRVDLGHLCAVAASAGIVARTGFAVEVPVRNGSLHLPTLGTALLSPSTTSTVVRWTDDGLVVDGLAGGAPTDLEQDAPGWLHLSRLSAEAGELSLAVDLEDLDVYRGQTYPSVSDRLDADEVRQWQRLFQEAWTLLVDRHRPYAEAIAAGLRSMVPQTSAEPGRSISASSTDAFGAVALSLPSDPANLALTLVHEFQHAKLSALLDLIPLYRPRSDVRYYAPWRDDPRPLGGLLQGVYAFVGVTDFWRVHRRHVDASRAALAHFEFARWREQTRRAVDELRESPDLTDAGRRLVDGLTSTLDGWLAEEVPADLADQARDSALDHRGHWRVRNIGVDTAVARGLADAWLAGEGRPAAIPSRAVTAGGAVAVDNLRHRLWHLRLTEPQRFALLCSGDLHDPGLAAATTADLAYAAGDYAAAARLYREHIDAAPDVAGAWLGLALSRLRCGDRESAAALLAEPELLTAVNRSLHEKNASVDPESLARWLYRPVGAGVVGAGKETS